MTFRSKRRRGGFRRPRVPLRWTAQHDILVLTTGTLDSGVLVAPTDYEFSTTLEPSGAVIKRIRGWIDVGFSGTVTPATARICFGILRMDADTGTVFGATGDPRIAAQLIAEDWLWTKGMFLSTIAAQATNGWNAFEVDVQAQRRLKDDDIRFVAAVDPFTGGGTVNVNVYARALLAMKASG